MPLESSSAPQASASASRFGSRAVSPAARSTASIDEKKTMSPLTAYCLGLAESCPELEQFPALGKVEPGVFRHGTADSEEPTTDAWPGAVAV